MSAKCDSASEKKLRGPFIVYNKVGIKFNTSTCFSLRGKLCLHFWSVQLIAFVRLITLKQFDKTPEIVPIFRAIFNHFWHLIQL